jgi:phospholipase C
MQLPEVVKFVLRGRRAAFLAAFALVLGTALASGAGVTSAAKRLRAPSANSVQTASPIKHVILIVGENHSFDNVFGTYRPRGGRRSAISFRNGSSPPPGYPE